MLVIYCFLTLGYLVVVSTQECRIQNIHESIVRCSYNGFDVNTQALPDRTVPDGTVCTLLTKSGMAEIYCVRSFWKQNGTSELSTHLRRSKRGFVDVLACVLTFFSCLWAGRGGHSDRTRPNVLCHSPGRRFVNDPLQINAKVSWPNPTATDNKDGHITPKRISGRAPGSHFPDGQHTIRYEAKDRSGNRGTCDIHITVTVVRCDTPAKINNGYFQCFPSADFIYGATCHYGCYEGFDLHGHSSMTCQKTGSWSTAQPRCIPWQCKTLHRIADADEPNCSDKSNFRSVCSYNCKVGYDMPSGVSKALVCSKTKTWRQRGNPKCVDVEPPVFKTCPSTILRGTDSGINSTTVNWEQPIVYDNSDDASALLKHGGQSGSIFTTGTYTISYNAEDATGNKALHDCSFNVVVRDIRCHRLYPTPYLHFKCPNGYRSGTRCEVACDPGKTLEGTNDIGCDRSRIGLFGEWNWQNGEQSRCINTRACPSIPPPTKGAVVCDNWEGGQFCQVQCQNGTEMSSVNLKKLYVCKMNGEWSSSPPGDRTCRTRRHAVLTFGIEASYYFSGDCTDKAARQQIAQNFISTLQNSIRYQPEACPDNSDVCNADNVQITCGKSTRRKRSLAGIDINGTYIQLNIHLPIKEQDIENEAGRYAAIYENISQILRNNTAEIFGNETVTPVDITTSGVQVQCPTGSVKSEQSLNCVDCTEGTFYRIQSGKPYCEPCSKGTFQNRAAQNKCSQCPYKTTTRTVGAVSLHQCIDECPPGSYSQDGAVPCSPCEQGYYQPSYGRVNCRACKGSKSTLSFGAISISSCKEFDFEFMPEEWTEVSVNFRRNITMTDFTLSAWLMTNINTNSSTTGLMTISLGNDNNNTAWKWEDIQEISDENDQVALTEFNFEASNSQWHHILLYRIGCVYTLHIGHIPHTVQNVANPGNCNSIVFNTLTITADTVSKVSLSMLNIWHGEKFSDIYRHRCSINEVGDVISWKTMEESHLSGAYIHIPSRCDDFDNCASSPCQHGSCQDVLHGYKCTCDKGFFGQDCEVNEDDCNLSLCINNATCIDGVSTYTCICPPHFTGDYCEIEQADGNWSDWGNWSECSTTCDNGTMLRHRLCNNPTPDNGGNDCTGENLEIQVCQNQECPVCPTLVPPTNGYLSCQNDSASFNCTILCDDGYAFDIEPLPLYFCGPDTSQVWNFETDENPERRLPKCVSKGFEFLHACSSQVHAAKKLSVSYSAYYRDLYCDTLEVRQGTISQIHRTLTSMIEGLLCIKKKTCELENMQVVNCHEADDRERRSIISAGFNIDITIHPTNDSKDESLSDLEQSFQEVQTAADNGNLTVDVLNDEYVIDGSLTDITGKLDCGFGKTRVDHFCVPCGRGSYLHDDMCVPCPIGTYQDEEGQQSCITCPNGKSTTGMFTDSMEDCNVDAISEIEVGVTGILVGGVTGLAVVIVIAFVYRPYRSKVNELVTPMDLQTHTPARHLGPAKPVFSETKT